MLGGAMVLFLVTLLGIYIACRVFAYQISTARKLGAAACFATLNVLILPFAIPFLSLVLPPVALYVCLRNPRYGRQRITKVFALTFLITVSAIAILYSTERIRQTAMPLQQPVLDATETGMRPRYLY